ncbi:MAG: DUF1016 family protein [Gammaproteobacteria bacterium]|nr:DUF1016 family protein [Gammaproteobacteria bacterium]
MPKNFESFAAPRDLALDKDYLTFLMMLKEKLQRAQISASMAANTHLIQFYWGVGQDIIKIQASKQWGSKFLEQLSHDMRNTMPGMQGLSKRNLEHMRRLAQLYPTEAFAKQAVSQLPWGHIIKLMQSIDNENARNWYAQKTLEHGWSRSILSLQIDSDLYARQADSNKKVTNFEKHLPKIQSDLARDLLKDPYKFDFLTIDDKAKERDIENALAHHIRDFLLELGQGFSFVGTQIPVTFDDEEYFIDMLFYHLTLRCYVVIELKATKFKPEHTGKLGFYLAAVDDQLRHPHDARSIGIILCQSKNKIIAEYALQNINAPIGISEYTLSKSLPKQLKTSLPSIKEIEEELSAPMQHKEKNDG